MYYANGPDGVRLLEFVYLKLFERTRKGVLSDEEMKVVERALVAQIRDEGWPRTRAGAAN